MNPPDAALNEVSVVSLLLREFSRQSVAEQSALKAKLVALVTTVIAPLPEESRIVLESSEGLSVVVIANPQAALDMAEHAQSAGADLPLCIGVNYGPIKAGENPGNPGNPGNPDTGSEIVGDGVVAALTVAKLATRGRLLVSRSFRDAVDAVAPHRAAALAPVGAFTDANVRTHELFTLDARAGIGRRRRILALAGFGAVAALGTGIGLRVWRASANRPGSIALDITPQGVVYVNGEMKGVSPPLRKLELAPGEHTIEVRNHPHPPLKLAINVKPAQEITVTHSFAAPRRGQRGGKDESYVEQLRRKWGI